MQIKQLLLSIPQETLDKLAKYHLIRESLPVWCEMIKFYDALNESEDNMGKQLSQSAKYVLTSEKFHLDYDHTRRIIRILNRYI